MFLFGIETDSIYIKFMSSWSCHEVFGIISRTYSYQGRLKAYWGTLACLAMQGQCLQTHCSVYGARTRTGENVFISIPPRSSDSLSQVLIPMWKSCSFHLSLHLHNTKAPAVFIWGGILIKNKHTEGTQQVFQMMSISCYWLYSVSKRIFCL